MNKITHNVKIIYYRYIIKTFLPLLQTFLKFLLFSITLSQLFTISHHLAPTLLPLYHFPTFSDLNVALNHISEYHHGEV